MKKYFISELLPGTDYAAGSQREDIESILLQLGYSSLTVPTASGNIISRLLSYNKARTLAKKLDKPGIVFFHFPVRSRVFRYFHSLIKARGVRTIAYEIDMEGLRDNDKKRLQAEMNELIKFDLVITQNEIKKEFIENKTGHKQVIVHTMHDYLGVNCKETPERTKSTVICFAGNLEKAPFVHLLGNLKGLCFMIYGATNAAPVAGNIIYKGKADPRELPCLLEGSFGLVWDGSSIQSGEGAGAYLRYNIPHKMALYIMAGLPLIVWKESAMSKWVQEQQVGVALNSLSELRETLEKISVADYATYQVNMKALREKMSEGYFLKKALRSAQQLLS